VKTDKAKDILRRLRAAGDAAHRAGMARFGINTERALGISVPVLRKMSREFRRDHALAAELWASGVHEARILATMIDDPREVTAAQMDAWVREAESWDLCDRVTGNLFDKTPFAHRKAMVWSRRKKEFVRRAGFSLMAALAVHDKAAADAKFRQFFPAIVAAATDDRNFVRKGVNWALRQIGKRNAALRKDAIAVAREIARLDSRAARWIAADALRELGRS
jgi:3-methyladenine DNA glycosylase AlkD